MHAFLHRAAALSACLLVSVGLSACGDDDDDAGTVTVHFDHVVGAAPLTVDSGARYVNAAGNDYTVTLLEYIVTDVELARDDGRTTRLRDEHYRNAQQPATASFTALDVPAGDYQALQFTFGIDGARNTTGALPATAAFDNMAWPSMMGGGYHYMRLEGTFDAAGETQPLLSHTGPSGGADYSIDVVLPVSLRVDGDDVEVHVVMDINEWFANPHTYDLTGRGMIMGSADAQVLHQDNGATVFRVEDAGDADHEHDE
jgi:hypothetical protein